MKFYQLTPARQGELKGRHEDGTNNNDGSAVPAGFQPGGRGRTNPNQRIAEGPGGMLRTELRHLSVPPVLRAQPTQLRIPMKIMLKLTLAVAVAGLLTAFAMTGFQQLSASNQSSVNAQTNNEWAGRATDQFLDQLTSAAVR
jgi:hypothetical protein